MVRRGVELYLNVKQNTESVEDVPAPQLGTAATITTTITTTAPAAAITTAPAATAPAAITIPATTAIVSAAAGPTIGGGPYHMVSAPSEAAPSGTVYTLAAAIALPPAVVGVVKRDTLKRNSMDGCTMTDPRNIFKTPAPRAVAGDDENGNTPVFSLTPEGRLSPAAPGFKEAYAVLEERLAELKTLVRVRALEL